MSFLKKGFSFTWIAFPSVPITILFVAAQMFAASVAISSEPIGRFCPQCMDQASAQAVAESMAPPPATGPGCDGQIPMGSQDVVKETDHQASTCPAAIRRTFIVNHHTDQVFAFEVWTEVSLPNSTPVAMTSLEQGVADRIIELRVAWDDFLYGQALAGLDANTISESSGRQQQPWNLRESLDCPEGTALDVYLDPVAMENLRDHLAIAATYSIPPFEHGQSWVRRVSGVGANIMGTSFTVQWEPSVGNTGLFGYQFDVSEHPQPPLPDRLFFQIEYIGDDIAGGPPILDVQFEPEISRVAGMSLQALETGGEISTECATAKIEAALNEQDATFHIPPGDPSPGPFPDYVAGFGSGFDYCTKTLTAKVDGIPQYTFSVRTACNRP